MSIDLECLNESDKNLVMQFNQWFDTNQAEMKECALKPIAGKVQLFMDFTELLTGYFFKKYCEENEINFEENIGLKDYCCVIARDLFGEY